LSELGQFGNNSVSHAALLETRPRIATSPTSFGETAESDPPEAVALDTSAVVEFLLPFQRSHRQWREFFATCAEHGTVLIFNQLLDVELSASSSAAACAAS
jgi:hypothetical protein